MALINTGPNYTRTGDNFLTRWGNRASFLPNFLGGGLIAGFLNMAGAIVESAGWLFRGKFVSAATTLAAGTASAAVNGLSGLSPLGDIRWFVNIGSGVATGQSAGTHARALTEGIIGSVTGALGSKPTVLRSYTAGVGSIGNGNAGPGYYATRAANERGQDPNAMWNNYRNGSGADHVAALEASRGRASVRGV